MDRATFFKHFDLLADQQDAVAKMRELVLELAVRGKLVQQDPKAKPAITDLSEIEDEKRTLIEARKLRPNLVSEISKTRALKYEIPDQWRWFRLGDVAFFQEGPGIRNWQFKTQGIKLLNVQNIVDGKLVLQNTDRHISIEEFEKTYKHFAVESGDILFASSGASWGKTAWFVDPGYTVMLNTSMVRLKFYSKRCADSYLLLFLRTAFFKAQMEIQLAGIQPNFGSTHLGRVYIPLPPLAEQRRIVAKVDELMALCDELEHQQQAQNDAETLFHRSALYHLTSARDQASFATSWHRVTNHFDLLHDHPDAVTQLRQAILQLAVQGRLGTQNRNDEAANRLIAQARAQWPERKASERQDFKPEKPPYDLPTGWEWTCLDELGNTNPRNEADDKLEVAFTPMKFIAAEYGRQAAFEIRPWSEIKKGFTHFANNDVVLAKITPCFENGKSAVMRGLKNGIGAGTTELHVFRGYDGCVLPDYVLLFLKTSHFIETGVPRMTGSAGQKRVPWDYFANSPFPLPPLAEQKRIVTMVNDLMQQCDALELQLNDSRTLGTQLLDSTIHHLFVKPEQSDLAASSGGGKK